MRTVSLLMSTYNPDEAYFALAVRSALDQSFGDFDFVIVDDCSREPAAELLGRLGLEDPRIRVVRNEANSGLTVSLNRGLAYCRGEYVARMDDDDIMAKDRLEKQVSFLKANPGVAVCFSEVNLIDKRGDSVRKIEYRPNADCLKMLLLRGNIFCHSSLMARLSALRAVEGYDARLFYAQDYDLYIRLAEVGRIGVVHEKLMDYRINPNRRNPDKACIQLVNTYYPCLRYYVTHASFKNFLLLLRRTVRFSAFCLLKLKDSIADERRF